MSLASFIADLAAGFVRGYAKGQADRMTRQSDRYCYDFMAHVEMLAQGVRFPLVNLTHNAARFSFPTRSGNVYTVSLVYTGNMIQASVWSLYLFPNGIPAEVMSFVADVNQGMEHGEIGVVHVEGNDMLLSKLQVNPTALTPQVLEGIVGEIGPKICALDILLVQNGYVR